VVNTAVAGTAASGSTMNLAAGNALTEVKETLLSGWALSSAVCVDNNAAATGNPASFGALSGATLQIPAINVRLGSDLVCTFTNVPTPATLTVTQRVVVTAPATFNPPVTLSYTGNNGWAFQQVSNMAVNAVTKGVTQTLMALNVPTTLTVALPTSETGWSLVSIRCTDTNAAASGNPLPPTLLASSTTNPVTIPANYVVAKAALQCAVIGSRLHQ
jgi:putative flippase GtrA